VTTPPYPIKPIIDTKPEQMQVLRDAGGEGVHQLSAMRIVNKIATQHVFYARTFNHLARYRGRNA
jgi:hypothetical protein